MQPSLQPTSQPSYVATTTTFSTPGKQSWIVPWNVYAITVSMWGAGGSGGGMSGGGNGYAGGSGGFVTCNIAVTPGQTIYALVGGGGSSACVTGSSTSPGGKFLLLI